MNLCDTGPLINLIDDRQVGHSAVDALFAELIEPPITTIACIAEAVHILRKLRGWQRTEMLFEMIHNGSLRIAPLGVDDLARMRQLMSQYRNVPMDFADASLVTVAERLAIRNVISIDNDFFIYRLRDGQTFNVLRRA